MNSFFRLFIIAFITGVFMTVAIDLGSSLDRYLLLSCALFSIGIYGLISSRNVVRILMSIELLLNAANINLVAFSNFLDSLEINGQIFALFVMAIAAAEAAIALAIILAIYKNTSSVDIEDFAALKW